MLTKLSVLTLFLRFVPRGKLRIVIFILMAMVISYVLISSFDWLYLCRPIGRNWDHLTPGTCIDWLKIAIFGSVMNIFTDLILLIMPVIILKDLRLPKKQKLGVILILMTGGL